MVETKDAVASATEEDIIEEKKSPKRSIERAEERLYEVSYLVVPTIPEGEMEKQATGLATNLEKIGGLVISSGVPVFRKLAYTIERKTGGGIEKYSQAYFGTIRFSALPEHIDAVKRLFDSTSEIVRYLILLTTPEAPSTLVSHATIAPSTPEIAVAPMPNIEQSFSPTDDTEEEKITEAEGIDEVEETTVPAEAEDTTKIEKAKKKKKSEKELDEDLDKRIDELVID